MVTNEEAVAIIQGNAKRKVDEFRGILSTELAEHERRSFADFSVYETADYDDLALLLKWPNVKLKAAYDSDVEYIFDFFLCADGQVYWRCSGEVEFDNLEDEDEDEDDAEWGKLVYDDLDWVDDDPQYDAESRIGCILEVSNWNEAELNFYLSQLDVSANTVSSESELTPAQPGHRTTRDI
jgi:hypothetical protein